MSFKDTVESLTEIRGSFQSGLTALDSNSGKIKPDNTRLINGSVNLDDSLKKTYPNANRWDYIIGYNDKAYFVEIHPAAGGEVKVVLLKLEWLKAWLKSSAGTLNGIKADDPYHWIASGKMAIPKTSNQYKIAARNGMIPKSHLALT